MWVPGYGVCESRPDPSARGGPERFVRVESVRLALRVRCELIREASQTGRRRLAGRYGVIAMGPGSLPTLMALLALFAAVLIGVTVPETELTT